MTEPESTPPDVTEEAERASPESAVATSPEPSVEAEVPTFDELTPQTSATGEERLDPFLEVTVDVWAELGRVTVPLGQLLKMGPGSVLKLDRPVSAPVDLMAQGVCFARGEVVIVDDYFAIRIKEIETNRRRGSLLG